MGGHKPFPVRSGDLFFFDPDELVLIDDDRSKLPIQDRFVRNIMKHGVIKPVIITKDGDRAVVYDGKQRTRHAREANRRLREEGHTLIRVPCVYRRGDEIERLGVTISANEFAQHDDPLTKARTLQHYLAVGGSEEDAAVEFGVDVSTIRGWLKLLELAPEVKKAVTERRVSPTAAVQLASLSREKQTVKLEELAAAGGKMTVERVRKAAKGEKDAGVVKKKLRARSVVESAMMLKTPVLRKMDGFQALEWVMGWKDIPELDGPA